MSPTTRAVARVGLLAALALELGLTMAGSSPGSASVTTQPVLEATALRTYPARHASQGVGVDRRYFYAVSNRTLIKHDRKTGEPVLRFVAPPGGPIDHLNSATVVKGRLYAAHSNYPQWPMKSSIEIFDTRSLEHLGSHAFGVYRGSLTWLDRHDGSWWAAFANYDRIQRGQTEPYGATGNTRVVRLDDSFQVVQSWTIPKPILDRFAPMSNSGGSWGPDGRLWLTGHDLPEAYVMNVPRARGELEWVATVRLPGIEGQGIAWDNAESRPTLWGISREDSSVTRFRVPVESICGRTEAYGVNRKVSRPRLVSPT